MRLDFKILAHKVICSHLADSMDYIVLFCFNLSTIKRFQYEIEEISFLLKNGYQSLLKKEEASDIISVIFKDIQQSLLFAPSKEQ